MVFKYGESKNSSKSGLVVIGTDKPFQPIAPGRLTLRSTNKEDFLTVIVKGVGLEGKGVSEFVGVKGHEPIQTKESFTTVNELVVNSAKENEGRIYAQDASGEEIIEIKPHESRSQECRVLLKQEQKVVAWGLGVEGDPSLNPHTAYLSLYNKGKRWVLHKLSCSQSRGEVDKWFKDLVVPQGAVLVVEYITTGDEDTVHGWFELEDV